MLSKFFVAFCLPIGHFFVVNSTPGWPISVLFQVSQEIMHIQGFVSLVYRPTCFSLSIISLSMNWSNILCWKVISRWKSSWSQLLPYMYIICSFCYRFDLAGSASMNFVVLSLWSSGQELEINLGQIDLSTWDEAAAYESNNSWCIAIKEGRQ